MKRTPSRTVAAGFFACVLGYDRCADTERGGENEKMRTIRGLALIITAAALAGCGKLHDHPPSRFDQIQGYIARLELGEDPRLPSLQTYGNSVAVLMGTDPADQVRFRSAVRSLTKEQACLSIMWGWRAEEHRRAIMAMLVNDPMTNAVYIDYLRQSNDVPMTREDPCGDPDPRARV